MRVVYTAFVKAVHTITHTTDTTFNRTKHEYRMYSMKCNDSQVKLETKSSKTIRSPNLFCRNEFSAGQLASNQAK